MHSRPAVAAARRGAAAPAAAFSKKQPQQRRNRLAGRAVAEMLETRTFLSVTNLIEGANGTQAGQLIPPNPSGAVGPSYVVNATRAGVQWFNKAGAKLGEKTLAEFYQPLGTISTDNIFEPKVLYDQYSGRFIVVALEIKSLGRNGALRNESHILVAASAPNSPQSAWSFQDIDSKVNVSAPDATTLTEAGADELGVGLSQDSIYLTANILPFATSTLSPSQMLADGFLGTRLWILPKSSLYNGGSSTVRIFDPVTDLGLPAVTANLTPAQTLGAVPPGVGTYLLAAAESTPGGSEQMYAIRVNNPLAGTSFQVSTVDLGDISDGNHHAAPQPWDIADGDLQKLDTIDDRVFNAVFRNIGGKDYLYGANVVFPTIGVDAGQATAHYYQFDVTDINNVTVHDQGDIGGEDIGAGVNTFFPAVTVNADGDIGIGFSASGPTLLPNNQSSGSLVPVAVGAYVTARLVDDAPHTVRQSLVLAAGDELIFSSADPVPWGRYSSVSLDYDAGGAETGDFWAYNAYGSLANLWGTRWGKFTPTLSDGPSLGDRVWNDFNGDGIQDDGEPGLQGVVFRLFDANDNLIQTVTSDENGLWHFEGPPTGAANPANGYRIDMDISGPLTYVDPETGLPVSSQGFAFSKPDKGAGADADKKDSDFIPLSPTSFIGRVTGLDLTLATFREDIDAGLFKPFVSFANQTVAVAEGDPSPGVPTPNSASLTVTVSDAYGPTTSPWLINLYYSTQARSASPDVDFVSAANNLLTIAPGTSSATLTIPVIADTTPEGDEFFDVVFVEPSTVGVSGIPDASQIKEVDPGMTPPNSATVIITDSVDVPTVSIAPGPTVHENGGQSPVWALFTVTLSRPSPYDGLKVNYATVDGTATSAGLTPDYEATSGTLTFDQGQLTQTVRVRVFSDATLGEQNETFTVALSAPVGLTIDDSADTAIATIVDVGQSSVQFGGQNSKVSYTDAAGNPVTISLTGPGSATLTTADDAGARVLVLDGTTEQSVLTIRSRGQTTFSSIQINGALARLNGQTANLLGSLDASGVVRTLNLNYISGGTISLGAATNPNTLVSLNIRRVSDSSITSVAPVRLLNVGSWIDTGTPDSLQAPAVSQIRATSDFMASVQATDIGTVNVLGAISDATISATNTIGTVNVRSVAVDTLIQAGASINSVNVRGGVFSNSRIVAPVINSLNLGTIDNTTGSQLRVATADRIGVTTWRLAGGKTSRLIGLDAAGDQDLGGNMVLHLT